MAQTDVVRLRVLGEFGGSPLPRGRHFSGSDMFWTFDEEVRALERAGNEV